MIRYNGVTVYNKAIKEDIFLVKEGLLRLLSINRLTNSLLSF